MHKLLTGRQAEFGTLRQRGGMSGYPSRAESEHDVIENSHASTSLSYADGLAKAYQLRGESDRAVVAIIGDGALTGGMAWEALNNIAVGQDRRLVIVVNDNGRSYSADDRRPGQPPGHGRASPSGTRTCSTTSRPRCPRTPVVGPPLYGTLHGIKKGIKDVLQPQVLFEDLGLKYVGPIDGHDEAGRRARRCARPRTFGGPVHRARDHPEGLRLRRRPRTNEEDRLHQVARPYDPAPAACRARPRRPGPRSSARSWRPSARERPDVVAITAAMLHPTGLAPFAAAYPDRVYDVGIAEQHAVTSAAGLAMGGLHPVVAIYATFLNRAFDQVLMDVALHQLPVTFVLDRAGRHRARRGQPQRHVGRVDPAGRAGPADRRPARRRPARRAAPARRSRSADGPTVRALPQGHGRRTTSRRSAKLGGMDVLRQPGRRHQPDVLLLGPGRWR